MQTKLHFSRFEFKYVLTARAREELESQLQYFVELDPFVADREGAKYFVRSLYLDNEALDHYFEKTDGLKRELKPITKIATPWSGPPVLFSRSNVGF